MKNMYIFGLFKNIFKRKNFTTLIYLVLNIYIILYFSLIACEVIFQDVRLTVPVGILVYCVSVMIGLSPIGEAFFRKQQGCAKITDAALLNRLEPLFMEVKKRAMKKYAGFHIDERTALYIKEDADVNAFAVGRRTICVTTGLLALSDDEIKAVIGHEFGHLATHDTDLILLISSGNFIITGVLTVTKVIILIFKALLSIVGMFLGGKDGGISKLISVGADIAILIYVNLFMYIWTKLGVWLVMKSSRDAEYEADAFSCNLGYTEPLLSFFHQLSASEAAYGIKESENLFAALSASHPSTQKRIAAIESRIGTVAR